MYWILYILLFGAIALAFVFCLIFRECGKLERIVKDYFKK